MKTKDQYETEILKIIRKENIFLISDIFAFYKGCSRSTFYTHELDKLDSIKNAIEDNKIVTKNLMKAKWLNSENATLQLALFKTICTENERKALSLSYQPLADEQKRTIDFSKVSDEALNEIVNAIERS